MQIEVQCSKNYFYIFLPQNAGAFGKHRKGTAEITPKIEKICILYVYREYLLCLQSNASGSFLQKCIDFVQQWQKCFHFESSIIPETWGGEAVIFARVKFKFKSLS